MPDEGAVLSVEEEPHNHGQQDPDQVSQLGLGVRLPAVGTALSSTTAQETGEQVCLLTRALTQEAGWPLLSGESLQWGVLGCHCPHTRTTRRDWQSWRTGEVTTGSY